jgi:hypothetical protein
MTVYDLGDGVPLRLTVKNGDGDLVDTDVTLTVTDPNGAVTTPGIDNTSVGIYEAEQIVPQVPGLWTYVWSSTGGVVDNTHGAFVVAGTAGWASTADVLDITGVIVIPAQLAQAQAVISVYVNRTPDADAAASARDLYWLKQAVCWQAAWLIAQVGYHARTTAKVQIQDGHHLHTEAPHQLQLAPLATRAIRNLSWVGNSVLSLADNARVPIPAFNTEPSDAFHGWEVRC